MFSDLCTGDHCSGHNLYVPSSSFVNSSETNQICYSDGHDCASTWIVNDTMSWGGVDIQATFGALYETTVDQPFDGNIGIAKAYWYGGAACVAYPSFPEYGYIQGALTAPVLAWYIVRFLLFPSVNQWFLTLLGSDHGSRRRRTWPEQLRSTRRSGHEQVHRSNRLDSSDPRYRLAKPFPDADGSSCGWRPCLSHSVPVPRYRIRHRRWRDARTTHK